MTLERPQLLPIRHAKHLILFPLFRLEFRRMRRPSRNPDSRMTIESLRLAYVIILQLYIRVRVYSISREEKADAPS